MFQGTTSLFPGTAKVFFFLFLGKIILTDDQGFISLSFSFDLSVENSLQNAGLNAVPFSECSAVFKL